MAWRDALEVGTVIGALGVTAALLFTSMAGCGQTPAGPSKDGRIFTFDFATSSEGWSAGFSDYPVGWEQQMDLVTEYRPLPSPLDQRRGGLFIGGTNSSDDRRRTSFSVGAAPLPSARGRSSTT
jgi:hypothetical protein